MGRPFPVVCFVLLVFLACFVTGCSGPLADAEKPFLRGEYPQAKELLVALDAASRDWSGRSRAEYALYRGLTCLALGDRVHALPWLREARSIDDTDPGALTHEDARRLSVAIEANAWP